MKKLLAVVITIFLTVPVFAADPTMKGNFVVTLPLASYWSGSGDLYEVGSDKRSEWSVGINDYAMGFQWFAISNLAIGGSIAYSVEKTGSTATSKTFSVMPEISYYMPMGTMLPFLSAAYMYEKEDVSDEKAQHLPVKLGVAFMAGNNLAPYISVSYTVIDSVETTEKVEGNKITVEAGAKAFF